MSLFDLKLSNVSKRYRIRESADAAAPSNLLKGTWKRLFPRTQDFWAVRDVNFEVPPGEVLGIIGHNGAGKSTILKLLSNIIVPTRGEIAVRGRLAALIEVGSGFHPELTGRENVYLSGSLLGMSRADIRKRIDEIIQFAGVETFIDTPVKRFSSGMYVRLGFAVAAHIRPDVLLLDEVLAVGDAEFQEKCINHFQKLRAAGTTVLFISHDLTTVARLCDRVLLMEHGRLIDEGKPHDVISHYKASLQSQPLVSSVQGDKEIGEITSVTTLDGNGRPTSDFHIGDRMRIRVEFNMARDAGRCDFMMYVLASDDKLQCVFTTLNEGPEPLDLNAGRGAVEFDCPAVGLARGFYYMDAYFNQRGTALTIDLKRRCHLIQIHDGKELGGGLFYPPHTWRLERELAASATGRDVNGSHREL